MFGLLKKKLADLSGSIVGYDTAFFHNHCPVRIGENVFQAVFGDNDGSTQFRVYFSDSVQKIRSSDRV